MQLVVVELNSLAREQHQRDLRFDGLTGFQPFLELLQERALRRSVHLAGEYGAKVRP
jgi:hypothetical protein